MNGEITKKNLIWDNSISGLSLPRSRIIDCAKMPKSLYSKRHQLLCELLLEARHEAGMTQQQLADKLRKPQSYIAKVEGGERRLDIIEFVDLCHVTDTDPCLIMDALEAAR